jgi:hypothetical protein
LRLLEVIRPLSLSLRVQDGRWRRQTILHRNKLLQETRSVLTLGLCTHYVIL